MQKLLVPSLAIALAAAATAQGPGVLSNANVADINNLKIGVAEIGQNFVIPDPQVPGGYFGAMTAKAATGATGPIGGGWDFITFIWGGPGSTTCTADLNALDPINSVDDEFQCSILYDGNGVYTMVGDAGPMPVNGKLWKFTRAGLTAGGTVSGCVPITGVPAGYIDPQIGTINGQAVIWWADTGNGIKMGDIDTTTGAVTNVRDAIAPAGRSGFQFWHSPTPVILDASGETRALIASEFATGEGSDGFFQSAPDLSCYSTALTDTVLPLRPEILFNDGTDWNANPLNICGTAYYADAAGTYGDQMRIDYFSLSSDAVDGTTGGTAELHLSAPAETPSGTILAALNIGLPLTNGAGSLACLDPNAFGIPGVGELCLSAVASLPTTPMLACQSVFNVPVPAGLPTLHVHAEAIAFDAANNQVLLSNVAFIQVK